MAIVGDYDDAAQQITDPVVCKFLENFTGNDELCNYFEQWCAERCAPFAGKSFDGEHEIGFDLMHKEYVALWESQLEGFLAAEGVNSEDFGKRVQQVQMKHGFGPEWVPTMVNECDYRVFFENMVARADTSQLQAAAQSHVHTPDPSLCNFSGVFQRDMAHGSTLDEMDALWKKVGIPYPMRVLFRKGTPNTVSTVNHEGIDIHFTQKIPYFPSKVDHYVADGVQRDIKAPILGWTRQLTAWLDGAMLRAQSLGNPNLNPETGTSFTLQWTEGKTHMVYTQTMNFKDGTVGQITHYMTQLS